MLTHLMIRQHNKSSISNLLSLNPDHLNISHGHVIRKHLNLLNDHRLGRLSNVKGVDVDGRDKLDDLSPCRANVDNVVDLAPGGPDGGVDGDDGEALFEAGADKERASDIGLWG
jgi:hypothetical protein